MLELIAQGVSADMRWRRTLPEGLQFELGRTTRPWAIGWDANISRRHMKLQLYGQRLRIQRLDGAANPIFFQGEEQVEFEISPGEHFVVGQTTFTLSDEKAVVTLDVPNPIYQRTFSTQFLRQMPYRDASRRMEVLNRLPYVLSSASDDDELLDQMTHLLLSGISQSQRVGFVKCEGDETEIIHWDHLGVSAIDFQPSERLIRAAVEGGTSVLHLWSGDKSEPEFTIDYESDWAFAIPLTGIACQGWCIYVSGNLHRVEQSSVKDDQADLSEDIKFAELIGSTLANVLQVTLLERQQAGLRPFFAPVVRQALADQDPDAILQPRECDVSVLFCDLRGFSRTAEQMAGDLIGLLEQVSEKLGILTRNILTYDGVVGDFHGDAAMGFWGWPIEQRDAVAQASLAAIAIQREIVEASHSNRESNQLEIGMGIATGRAVVGMIGTSEQVKVTAFGPVVNLASRLEGLTRWFSCPILTDASTVLALSEMDELDLYSRRVARVQPFGMRLAYDIHELLTLSMSAEHRQAFDAALAAFEYGNWLEANRYLEACPATDGAASFLRRYIMEHGNPPGDWQGTIVADSK